MKEGYAPGGRDVITNREDDDDDDRDLGPFRTLSQSASLVSKESYSDPPLVQPTDDDDDDENQSALGVTTENFAQLGEVIPDDYYKQYVPYYSQLQGSPEEVHTNKDALMTKLNYMIHLLEEQQDEKTDNVTEELVLYLFLGVFVIFVVDSFARVGKYTR